MFIQTLFGDSCYNTGIKMYHDRKGGSFMNRILIIGGGASGMAAAISAAQANPSAQITILDGLDRIGKKILATGNGRCN